MSLAIVCLLLAFLSSPVLAAVIKVTPDRDPVRMDESFNLAFSSDESPDGDPDFNPLRKDFEILAQDSGSQVSIVNGKMSRKEEWTLTLSPKRAGAIPIPAISFGSDHSQPTSITVLDAASATPSAGEDESAEVKLEVDAEPRNPYVQAQVIYTVRVLLRVNLAGANLNDPQPADALIERLGEDHRYSVNRGGREYTVIERKFAIFPQKSGLLRLDPLHLDAQVEVGGRSFFSRSTRTVRVKSEGVDLKVRPIPAEFSGKHWLPARSLTLEENWSQNPPRTKAGEPITRTLTLRAQGATVGVLPELGANLSLDPSIKQYPDQPALNEEKHPNFGLSSSRQEKAALIPGKAGEYKLPALEVPWWNTQADRMELARLPERSLRVEPSEETASQPTPPAAPLRQAAPELPQAPTAQPSQAPASIATGIWFWLSLFFAAGWLATALGWWWGRHSASPAKAEPDRFSGERQARKTLQQACANHDPAAARRALLDWAQTYWPEQRPASLSEIAGLSGGMLSDEITRINQALYQAEESRWRGEELWAAVQTFENAKRKPSRKEPGLEPLYR
ncbi:MAG: BatD family protein [Methylococcaceae bacterium]|nr:BatD family protein [Methylococcaceae bacterium]